MGGPIQLGDALRLAELAWTVYEYGWAEENNAGENYRAFGADVRTLHESLKRLEGAVERAQRSLLANGAAQNDILLHDRRCFSDIVGDYEDTLRACHRLIYDNRRYAQTTGPMQNIEWNINVMPLVRHLHGRIQMHNYRLQHMLKPFEIDLVNNFQGNMSRGMISIQTDVRRLQRDVTTLIAKDFPHVARAIGEQEEQRLCSIEIPADLTLKFDYGFEEHEDNRPPSLQDMTDCFLVYFGRSTVRLPLTHHEGGTPMPCPPSQYLALLKCQYLMGKIKASHEIKQPPSFSYWPGYVRALEESLAQQCARFEGELTAPEVSHYGNDAFSLWPMVERQDVLSPLTVGPRHQLLLELPLDTESETMAWRTIQLFRQEGSAHRFRIIEEWGDTRLQKPEAPRVVDFDIRTALLFPMYADPVGEKGELPPLEIILEHSHASFKYVFRDLRSLLKFQEALTGYTVAGSYTQFHARAVFVRPRKEEPLKEDATVQIWIPQEADERNQVLNRPDQRKFSSDSQLSLAPSITQARRAHSVSSTHSGATASSASQSSSIFEDTPTTIRKDRGPTASQATIRSLPRKPLLVMFVRNRESTSRSIVAISIDGETRPNPELCRCQYDENCYITAVHQERGPSSTLHARRLSQSARWNLLSITSRAPEWHGLLRVSILFPTVENRQRMAGTPCRCRIKTEEDVDKCLAQKHQGLLGIVRVMFRRQMINVQEGMGGHQVVSN